MNDYLLTIYNGGLCVGQGVVVGEHFLTSGHLIKEGTYIVLNNEQVSLTKNDAIICKEIDVLSKDLKLEMDIAVFHIDGINSPLVLASELPQIGQRLTCFSRTCHVKTIRTGPSVFDTHTEFVFEKFESEGTVSRMVEGLFECNMDTLCKEGHSGSPIMSGLQVFGVLCGDIDGKHASKKALFQPISTLSVLFDR